MIDALLARKQEFLSHSAHKKQNAGPRSQIMVIAFQSIVAVCAFVGLGALLQHARRTTLIPARDMVARPEDHIRMGLALRSHGQASGPN
jgi:hypothetical protein